jgi:hypothetical protein
MILNGREHQIFGMTEARVSFHCRHVTERAVERLPIIAHRRTFFVWPESGSSVELEKMVGAARFELATSCTPSKRASQATLRPEPLPLNGERPY